MDTEVLKAKVSPRGALAECGHPEVSCPPGRLMMASPRLRLQLLGLGTALLENVDPNPENYVCAGVIQTKSQQVGCLLRLEPNAQAQVRAPSPAI